MHLPRFSQKLCLYTFLVFAAFLVGCDSDNRSNRGQDNPPVADSGENPDNGAEESTPEDTADDSAGGGSGNPPMDTGGTGTPEDPVDTGGQNTPIFYETTLTWIIPDTYTDNSLLTNLGGHHIYMDDGNGIARIHTINDKTTNSHVVNSLAAGSYRFIVTAFDTNGIESEPSNEAQITLGM